MHFIFEEGGEIKAATAIGQAVASADVWQAQTQFGKRIKLKAKEVWLKWEGADPSIIMDSARALTPSIDIDFLWECSPHEEFSFDQIAKDYFGEKVSIEQFVSLAMVLQSAPIYFRRKGRGHFLRAPEEQLKAALLSVERKKQEALTQETLKEQMLQGILPAQIAEQTQQLLYNPDKNHFIYKALASASSQKGITNAQLLLELGAIQSALEIHQGRFFKEHFPKGLAFSQAAQQAIQPNLLQQLNRDIPLANVQAFSIDDAATTEIDDAFSVTPLANGHVEIGIHIAAPSLAIQPGDSLDEVASHRMSTAYFPGGKITMLPKSVIDIFSLEAGQARPAISLYVEVNTAGEVVSLPPHRTVIERVPIQENLRLHQIEDLLTQDYFDGIDNPATQESTTKKIPFEKELSLLWRCAKLLFQQRQEARVAHGQKAEKLEQPDPNALPRDFHFTLHNADGTVLAPEAILVQPVNDAPWQVDISARSRGSVVDTVVAEWMIFSNRTWGTHLVNHDLPAIFRAQQGWGAQRTRMQTSPCRHEGLGVENYAWCTSPLRRYADLVNQWQLIAVIKNGLMAKLAAAFKPKDTKIMGLCAEFDARYSSYNAYQQLVERYWCLRWLSQQGLPLRIKARTLKDGMVRIEPIPLRMVVPELFSSPRGRTVEIEVLGIDLLNLNANVRVLQIQDQGSIDASMEEVESDLDQEEPIIQVILDEPDPDPDPDPLTDTTDLPSSTYAADVQHQEPSK